MANSALYQRYRNRWVYAWRKWRETKAPEHYDAYRAIRREYDRERDAAEMDRLRERLAELEAKWR